jgi:hypothetical protein
MVASKSVRTDSATSRMPSSAGSPPGSPYGTKRTDTQARSATATVTAEPPGARVVQLEADGRVSSQRQAPGVSSSRCSGPLQLVTGGGIAESDEPLVSRMACCTDWLVHKLGLMEAPSALWTALIHGCVRVPGWRQQSKTRRSTRGGARPLEEMWRLRALLRARLC